MCTYHRHPNESASRPPKGAPVAVPAPNMIFIYPCQTPRSRRGTMSVSRMETTAFMPPPPMPATARETISWLMSWARPQPRQPRPKTT